MTARREDWPARLGAAIETAATRAFSWGRHDCALAACDCIAAMTGTDPAAGLRGRYRSAAGAARALKRLGFADLTAAAAALTAAHGCREILPAFATGGDLVLVDLDDTVGLALGIVDLDGRRVLVAALAGGWRRLPLMAARRAWRVPFAGDS